MFGSVVRSKFAMIVAAPIIATVAIIGTSSLAFAAQPATAPPVVVSFTASSTSLTYLGGKVALTASLEHAISCTVTVTPGLKGFPESFPCSKTVTTRFSLRRNKTATALSYSFALQVRNKAASVEATPVVVAEAALPAPVVSSFTATAANLPYTGGKVVLIAGFAYGSSCDMAVTPALRGFPKSFACTTHLRIPVTLGANVTGTALSYSFALSVKNNSNTVAPTPVVVVEGALPAPVVSSFAATSTSLPYSGGKIALKASFQYASTCNLAVTPSLGGFPKSFPCANKMSVPVTLSGNASSTALSYSFALTVGNGAASVAATPVVVAEAALPLLPTPVVSSFTASDTSLSDLGGKVTLTASFQYGSACTMTVTPSVKGFSGSFPCAGKLTRDVTLAGNPSENPVDYTFALTVQNRTASETATNVVVSVGASPPPISLTPRSLTFANEGVYVEDDPLIVTVHNDASTTQVISGVAIGTAGEPTDFILNRNNCSYLTAHENCSFVVQFQPSGAGPRTGVVNVVDSSWGTAGGSVHLGLLGNGVWAKATVANTNITGNTLHFAVQGVLTTSSLQYVTVTNVGSVPLYISGIGVTGGEATDFSVSAGNCINQITNAYPFVVGLRQKCRFAVAFEPSDGAARSTNVVVDDNTIGTQTQLRAEGIGAYTTDVVSGVTESSGTLGVHFENTEVGTVEYETLTITNTGKVNLAFTGASITGINSTEFSIAATGTCVSPGVELAVGGSCSVQVGFNPAATGVRNAVLRIGDNTLNGFEAVDLTGSGTLPPPAT